MIYGFWFDEILSRIQSDFADEIVKSACLKISDFINMKTKNNFMVFSDYYSLDRKLSGSLYEMEVFRMNVSFYDYLIKKGL